MPPGRGSLSQGTPSAGVWTKSSSDAAERGRGVQEVPRLEIAIEVKAQRRLQDRLDLPLERGSQPQARHRLPLQRLQQPEHLERIHRDAALGVARALWTERAAKLRVVPVLDGRERCVASRALMQRRSIPQLVE